jgi:hypothetical protein
MTTMIVNVSNTSDKPIRLVLEPLVHVFAVEPSGTIFVHIDEFRPDQPIEIEASGDEIVLYAGGMLSAWDKDRELDPKFR